jgi:hypothetical protein
VVGEPVFVMLAVDVGRAARGGRSGQVQHGVAAGEETALVRHLLSLRFATVKLDVDLDGRIFFSCRE